MGFMDRIFIKKTPKGDFEVTKGGPSMGEMMTRGQGLKSVPAESPMPQREQRDPSVVVDQSLLDEELMNRKMTPENAGKVMNVAGGAEAIERNTLKKLEAVAESVAARARGLQDKETSMPSIEDAAEHEKEEVMRLDAESDAWSRIAGVFSRNAAEPSGLKRLHLIKEELKNLRAQNLGKGPNGEIMKFQAIEEVEKQLAI